VLAAEWVVRGDSLLSDPLDITGGERSMLSDIAPVRKGAIFSFVQQNRAQGSSRMINYRYFVLTSVGFLLSFFAFPAHIFAGLILSAEVRFTYEDNVVGLLSDQELGQASANGSMTLSLAMQGGGGSGYPGLGSGSTTTTSTTSTTSAGDFSTTLVAEAGGYLDITRDSEIYAKGFGSRTSYGTYTDLDATIGGVNAGMITKFGDSVSGRVSLTGKVKHFGDPWRNATSYGGNISLKEKLTPTFWLREFIEYEENSADLSVFSYTGTTVGISSGYALAPKTLAVLGYTYLVQQYDEPADSEMKTSTAYLSLEQTLATVWGITGEYAFQNSTESVTGSKMTNNVYSLSFRYSY
jgi:hypothetical protein